MSRAFRFDFFVTQYYNIVVDSIKPILCSIRLRKKEKEKKSSSIIDLWDT